MATILGNEDLRNSQDFGTGWIVGAIHQGREYKREGMGEKIMNSKWVSYVSN